MLLLRQVATIVSIVSIWATTIFESWLHQHGLCLLRRQTPRVVKLVLIGVLRRLLLAVKLLLCNFSVTDHGALRERLWSNLRTAGRHGMLRVYSDITRLRPTFLSVKVLVLRVLDQLMFQGHHVHRGVGLAGHCLSRAVTSRDKVVLR